MAGNLSVVTPEGTGIVVGDVRALVDWKDGKSTDIRRRDDITNADISGVAMTVVTPALGVAEGYVQLPDSLAAGLTRGAIVRLSGPRMTATLSSRRDSGDISVRLSGVENAEVVGVFGHQAKAVAK